MSPADRLVELLNEPQAQLDRIAAVIGCLPSSTSCEDDVVAELDALAAPIGNNATAEQVLSHVFGTLRFHGNTRHYYDPDNSIVQRVLERRTGVPLTLALVAIEIGRRAGVQLMPVGMPGHFLIGQMSSESANQADRFFDPFAGGRELDELGCKAIFERLAPNQSFSTDMLRAVDPTSVAARMLQNLRVVYLRQGDVSKLASVLAIRIELPGSSVEERIEYSKILAALGRFDQAADQCDVLAELQPDLAGDHSDAAFRHRARRN